MYALTRRKSSLYAALVVSQFTKLSFPTLSSLASKHACEHEKGRVLGALFATNAIASALGPLAMESVYNRTKDALFPGFMFVFAATLYLLGSLVAMMLPFVSRSHRVTFTGPTRSELTDPLLMTESIPSERNSTSIPNDFEAPVSIMDGETKSAFV